ncbi:MAG: hypothetical protein JWR50_1756 [Mucilaginibacter sp.]|nr:hypothetical protein [Mucilaginibacter sp.]
MVKRLLILSVIGICLGCHKNQQKAGCGTQVCTDIFVSVGIHFTDKNGNAIVVNNFTAIDQRTHLSVTPVHPVTGIDNVGYYVVTDDSMRPQLSTEGDDVLVSATDPATNQTKAVTLKLSGGCNCHVGKISGVDTIAFD